MTNPILEYYAAIESGQIVVGKKVRAVYRMLAEKVTSNDCEYYYDEKRAEHIIRFFERYLKHSKGKWGGKPIKLELWQKALFAAGWGFVNIEGIRQYNRIVLIVGKKNGKSLMSSGVGLYGLTADGEPGAEVYSLGTKRDQAKIIWDEARRMRNKSPALAKRLRATVAGLYYDETDSVFKPLASDANTLDGLNIYYGLMDEIHQWRNGRALYDIIADGVSAREQPMLFLTSTAGTVRDDIYDEIYTECANIINGYLDPDGVKDDRTLPIIYEQDERAEWEDEKVWLKANPNLGVSKRKEYLEDKVNRAKGNPRLIRNLVCKEFNIPETEQSRWLDFEDVDNRTTFEFVPDGLIVQERDRDNKIISTKKHPRPDYAVGGFDLSVRGDLTATVVAFLLPKDHRLFVMSMFFTPEATLESHIKTDKVPYDLWIKNGLVRVCPGNQIDYKMVEAWFLEIRDTYDIYLPWIGFDPAYSAYLVDDLKKDFGENALEPLRQGALTMGMPMATIEKLFKSHRVVYNNNPVMKWNIASANVEEDRNGNMMLCKRNPNITRIDGAAALLDAWAAMHRHMDEYRGLIGGSDGPV